MAGRVAKLLVGLVLGIASVAAADSRPVTIAILDFELIDDTGDTAARAAQETRLRMISNLILNINIEIKSVVTGNIVLKKSVDIRGNTDASWSRGVSHMLHDMAEKKQGGR